MKVITVLVMPSVPTMKEVLPVPVRRVSSQLTQHLVLALQKPSSVLTRMNVNFKRINVFHQIHIVKIPKAPEL